MPEHVQGTYFSLGLAWTVTALTEIQQCGLQPPARLHHLAGQLTAFSGAISTVIATSNLLPLTILLSCELSRCWCASACYRLDTSSRTQRVEPKLRTVVANGGKDSHRLRKPLRGYDQLRDYGLLMVCVSLSAVPNTSREQRQTLPEIPDELAVSSWLPLDATGDGRWGKRALPPTPDYVSIRPCSARAYRGRRSAAITRIQIIREDGFALTCLARRC